MSPREIYEQIKLENPSSIRLIRLLPAPLEEDVRCDLINADINDDTPYEAISYTWGDEDDKASIRCQGVKIQISRNLVEALERFRSPDTSRLLWADGICINQDDVQEKNHQVQLMGQIYQKAECVLIWLGQADDDLEIAEECILKLWHAFRNEDAVNQMATTGWEVAFNSASLLDYSEFSAEFDLPTIDDPALAVLRDFYRNPWFYRAWTFQESFLAKKRIVFQGWLEISGDGLLSVLVGALIAGGATDATRFLGVTTLEAFAMLGLPLSGNTSQFLSFRNLLNFRRGSGCKSPSDLIYSLLAVTNDKFDIVPDYGLSFIQVFSSVTLNVIRLEDSLDVLGDVDTIDKQVDAQLPSWLPDWRQKKSRSWALSINTEHYRCAGTTKPIYSVSADGRKLSVRGLRIDAIKFLSTECNSLGGLSNIIMEYAANRSSASNHDPGALLSLLKTLCCDLALRGVEESEVNERWSESTTRNLDTIIDDAMVGSLDNTTKFLEELDLNNRDNAFALTSAKARLGLVPANAHEHDVIVMLLGCNKPVVLRDTGNDGEFLFVGFCYVEGVMDSELLETIKDFSVVERPDVGSSTIAEQLCSLKDFLLV